MITKKTDEAEDVINTEQQMAEVKKELLDEMEADAELLGVKRKAKAPPPAEGAAAAAGAEGEEMVSRAGAGL